MTMKPDDKLDRVIKWTRWCLTLSLIGIIWLTSFYIVTIGFAALPNIKTSLDLATIISGTGAIALSIFSIILAIAAIYGISSLETKVRSVVGEVTKEHFDATKKELDKIAKESTARSFSILGYVLGEDSINLDYSAPTNVERLKEAIYHCEVAYGLLKNTGLPVEFMTLNNLLGYSCALRDKSRREFVLEGAARLRTAARDHNSANLLLTYARTILEFSQGENEINAACSLVSDLGSSAILNEKQKREASYLASLCSKTSQGLDLTVNAPRIGSRRSHGLFLRKPR